MTGSLLMTAFSLATAAAQVHPGTGREDGVAPVLSHRLVGLCPGHRAAGLVGHPFGVGFSWPQHHRLRAAFFVLTTALLNAIGMASGVGIAAIGGSPLVKLTGGTVAGLGLGISAGLV
jgi:hypothetical protein